MAALLLGLYSRSGRRDSVLSGTFSVLRILVRNVCTCMASRAFSASVTTSDRLVWVSSARTRRPVLTPDSFRAYCATAMTPSRENLSAITGMITSSAARSAATLASV